MTHIDFYLLEADNASVERFTAKLALDAYRQHQAVHIHNSNQASTQAMSAQLWQFSQSSFIAHAINEAALVTLGSSEQESQNFEQLIIYQTSVPDFFSRFEKLSIIIANNEKDKTQAREQYRFFKQRGYPLSHTSIKHNNF